ncbi:MAG: virulence RhuM family protein [Candidatus Peribacteraceae bacterium]|nr:virulence RhuM family protein [Candidatus Peribacteraceae bacterium]
MKTSPNSQIVIYKAPNGNLSLDVKLENETIWLSLNEIAELFSKDKSVISRHLKNIFTEHELERSSVVAKNATTAADGKTYLVEFYNLDAIISVGYRVNSKRATQFRQWATKTLHDHIVKGFTVNPDRLAKVPIGRVKEFEQAIALLESARQKSLNSDEAKGLLEVITSYAKTWLLLEKYDKRTLSVSGDKKTSKPLDLEKAQIAIAELKKKLLANKQAGKIFGQERSPSLAGILGNIEQSFDGKDLYPTLEEKAANLLYFLVKDHPFSDGNKRIGAFLFIIYLSHNSFLVEKGGGRKLNDNALTALTLLIAESNPRQKDTLIALTVNLLKKKV